MYLEYYALAFLSLCFIDKKNNYSWVLLCLMCFLLKLNILNSLIYGDYRYIVRTSVILITALLLLKGASKTCFYQSVVLCLFILSNLLMLKSISFDNYFYVNYEAIIYGLVFCQFIPALQRPWSVFIGLLKVCIFSYKDKRMAKES